LNVNRLGIRIPDSFLEKKFHKISYTAYRNPNSMFGAGNRPMTSVVSVTVDGVHQQNLQEPVKIFLRRESCDEQGKFTLNYALFQY